MNLISYNGFPLTFVKFILSNIVIRQVIINVVAILMHNDYHEAKIQIAEENAKKLATQKKALMMKVEAEMQRKEEQFIK